MSVTLESNGITKNPSMILDPVKDGLMGIDATIHSNDDTYSNGQAARCSIPDGVIMETDYYPADTFVGNHLVSVIYGSDHTASYCMELEVWRRIPGESEGEYSGSQYYSHSGVGYNITEFYGFFSHLYEYKFILKTTPDFAGTFVDVDLVQFLRVNKNNYHRFSRYSYSPDLSGLQNYIEYGSVIVSNDGADAYAPASVTFAKTFNTVPVIVATANMGGSAPLFVVNIKELSTTGFSMWIGTDDGSHWSGTTAVYWIAVGSVRPTAY